METDKNYFSGLLFSIIGIALGLGTAIAACAMGHTETMSDKETQRLQMELEAFRQERSDKLDQYEEYFKERGIEFNS